MTDNPNRCPVCWSSLPPAVTEFCIHCRANLAPKAPRRRWRAKEEAPVTVDAVDAPLPAYERSATPAYEPYASYQAPSAYDPPPPPPPVFPGGAVAAAGSAPGAVAVLERDPAEFPGTPLPDGFFDALPVRARRAPRTVNRKLIVVAVIGAGAVISGVSGWADRNDDIASPARHLVAGACAEYRDFTTRLDNDPDDVAAVQDGMAWFQSNAHRFAEAARLDPELQGAADFVVWFNGMIETDFAGADAVPDEEIDAREEPLTQACYLGAGRA